MNASKYFYILLSLFTLLAGVSACDRAAPPEIATEPGLTQTEADIPSLMKSMDIQLITEPVEVPDFTLPSLDGRQVSLSQYKGKIVLLSFWTTW